MQNLHLDNALQARLRFRFYSWQQERRSSTCLAVVFGAEVRKLMTDGTGTELPGPIGIPISPEERGTGILRGGSNAIIE